MTGKIPREVGFFKNVYHQNLHYYYNAAFDRFRERTKRVLNELPQDDQENFIKGIENLIEINKPEEKEEEDGKLPKRPLKVEGTIYDQGVVYKRNAVDFFPINEPARDALLSIYVNRNKIQPILYNIVRFFSLFLFPFLFVILF